MTLQARRRKKKKKKKKEEKEKKENVGDREPLAHRDRFALLRRRAPEARPDGGEAPVAELRRDLGLRTVANGGWMAKWQNLANFMKIFGGLVLGCIEADFCKKICVWQLFSCSTRFAHFRTAPNSTFEQKTHIS